MSDRTGFCPRCDAPIYSDQKKCGYCGGGSSHADFQGVVVLAVVALLALGLAWLLFLA